MSLYIDNTGIVWAGTDVGLISYWNEKWTSYKNINQLPQGEVYDIVSQSSNPGFGLWLATANGARFAKTISNNITDVSSYIMDSSGLLDNRINALVIDSMNSRWFATPKGLSIFKGNTWYSETSFDDLVLYPVVSLAAKSDGWIFAGTMGKGVGRFKYDAGIDGITGASYYNTDWTSLPSDTILSIYVDNMNRQWFGTPNGLAFHASWQTKLNWTTFSVKDGLINNHVQCIMGDNNNLWVGTAAGVSCYNGVTWKSYSSSDGLGNLSINDIAIDQKGTVWFATNGGISTFDGKSWKNFSKKD
jgi:ligand-binding sensor domain-containing protein